MKTPNSNTHRTHIAERHATIALARHLCSENAILKTDKCESDNQGRARLVVKPIRNHHFWMIPEVACQALGGQHLRPNAHRQILIAMAIGLKTVTKAKDPSRQWAIGPANLLIYLPKLAIGTLEREPPDIINVFVKFAGPMAHWREGSLVLARCFDLYSMAIRICR